MDLYTFLTAKNTYKACINTRQYDQDSRDIIEPLWVDNNDYSMLMDDRAMSRYIIGGRALRQHNNNKRRL